MKEPDAGPRHGQSTIGAAIALKLALLIGREERFYGLSAALRMVAELEDDRAQTTLDLTTTRRRHIGTDRIGIAAIVIVTQHAGRRSARSAADAVSGNRRTAVPRTSPVADVESRLRRSMRA